VDGREGWINQITDDHSFVEALLASGHITPEQAAVHPMRNVLYRALGQLEETEPDFYTRNLTEGDRLILCSDGLTRHVTPPELASTARQYENPETVAQKLIELANSRGGEDNISVIVIVMERAEDVPPEERPDPILFEDTEVGLYQAPEGADLDKLDPPTLELPAVDEDNNP
jgi:protein phosphatase